jgi:hypothetical protein
MKFPLLALMAVMLFQVGTSSPAAVLKHQRPLTATETETVVSGIRQQVSPPKLAVLVCSTCPTLSCRCLSTRGFQRADVTAARLRAVWRSNIC